MNTLLIDLHHYNRWANEKVCKLCDGLSDEQLDEPREIGFGTLRNTLFHILTVEEVWFDRWHAVPPKPFPTDACGMTAPEMARRLDQIHERRTVWLQSQSADDLQSPCTYQDSRGTLYTNPMGELIVHCLNHGVHHRAQAIHYLKPFRRSAAVGIDYLFYRFARPVIDQSEEAATMLRSVGLAVAEAPGMVLHWNREFISRCFQYGDWATEQLIRQIKQLSDSQLDHDFQMGPGTIRKTLSHLFDSEKLWLNNWTTGKRNFVHSPPDISIDVIETQLSEVRAVRHRFLEECTDADSHRILQACFGGPIFHAQVIETCLQLLGHGTHHRAQLVNMLRRSGHTPASVDYVVWLRSNAK
jgi:uncharacterized damage-inducible protein DinB